METIIIENDISVFYVAAASFPDGIVDAHQKLQALVPFSTTRKYFGVSRPENGNIVYRAATEETEDGEAAKLKCDRLILRKGTYISLTVHDYIKDLQSIERSFKQLLSQPGLDEDGYCVEWYIKGKDVKCMIRLADI